MNVLVTAGNTLAPIDRVRCITNIFTGRTGARIAREAHRRGHAVTLLTSHPETVRDLAPRDDRWAVLPYQTFQDLQRLLAECIQGGGLDAVVHSAAVSDYLSAGVYAPAPHTRFSPGDGAWLTADGQPPALVDRSAGKIKSDEPELWIRLVRAPKLVDSVRGDWRFRGLLVKFKLLVGVGDAELLQIAEDSRAHSAADLMVANTLEGSSRYAYLGPLDGPYQRVTRDELPGRLLDALERLHAATPAKGGPADG